MKVIVTWLLYVNLVTYVAGVYLKLRPMKSITNPYRLRTGPSTKDMFPEWMSKIKYCGPNPRDGEDCLPSNCTVSSISAEISCTNCSIYINNQDGKIIICTGQGATPSTRHTSSQGTTPSTRHTLSQGATPSTKHTSSQGTTPSTRHTLSQGATPSTRHTSSQGTTPSTRLTSSQGATPSTRHTSRQGTTSSTFAPLIYSNSSETTSKNDDPQEFTVSKMCNGLALCKGVAKDLTRSIKDTTKNRVPMKKIQLQRMGRPKPQQENRVYKKKIIQQRR